jgi:hypothetical protein
MAFFAAETPNQRSRTQKTSSFFTSPESNNPYDVSKVNNSISNAERRIEDAGYVKADADRRNWFEKLTNLPQGQNAFFDTLELLGRPGSGVVNAINEGIQGENALRGFGRGFAGIDRTRGSDLAETLGVENKIGKFALGTGLDIALDPLTYVPGGVLARGASTAARGVGNAAKSGIGAIERLSPGFATFMAERARPAAESGKEALGRLFVPDYKLGEDLKGRSDDTILRSKRKAENNISYQTEEAMKRVTDAAKLAGGLDKGTDVGRIMEAPLRQFDEVKAYEFPDGVTRTTSRKELTNAANAKRQQIEDLGKDIRDTRIESVNPLNLKSGDKAYKLSSEGKRIKGSKTSEIEETRTVNGSKEFRFKGESEFVPVNRIQGIGKQRTTDIGNIRQAITQTVNDLNKVDNDIRRLYFSRENAELRKLTSEKNQPANLNKIAESKAFEVVGGSPKFNLLLQRREELQKQLDSLRDNLKIQKQGNISQIQSLSDDVSALRNAAKNPITMQREIPRPARELSQEQGVRQAAETLIRSNNEMRDWATNNGIGVGELEGYMTHVLSAEERKRRRNISPIDRGNKGTGQPSKGVVKHRQVPGSVEDINERLERQMFEPNAFFATAIGQKRLIEYANAAHFRRQVLSNTNFARKLKEGERVTDLPKNQTVIDTNNYKFLRDDAGADLGLAEEIGGQYIVTKSVKAALDRFQKLTTDDGINSFIKAFDTAQSFWKRGTLFSVPYHLRNIAGAMFNNYVAGMSPANLAKYTKEGYEEAFRAYVNGKESPVFREFRQEGLGSSGQLAVEFARRGEEPEEAIRRTVEKRSKLDGTFGNRVKTELGDLKNPLNAFQSSQQFGDFNDQAMRFALYKWSRDKGMSAEQAANKVREVQFDYSRTTPFEREILTRAMPFYRWMRNNIPFQLRQFINDPRKYANVNKIRLNAQEAVGLEDENVPDWMKENFAIPVSGDEGKGRFLGLNLPVGDLTKLSSPLKTIVDSSTPLVKLPAELALNRSFFFDKPIEKFEGQEKKYSIPTNFFGIPIPGAGASLGGIDSTAAYIAEQLGGQPVRAVSNFFTTPSDADQDKKFRDPGLGISSILKEYDADKAQYFQQVEELQKLQDLLKYIEQQTGNKPRTIAEINR